MKEALLLLLLFLFYVTRLISATVVLKPFAISFPDLPAKFALAVNSSGICGALHVADPVDACSPLRNRFEPNQTDETRLALIIRGECSFEDKIQNAQNAGFHAAIVYEDRDKRNLVYMLVNPEGIKVHAVFVSKAAGEVLKERAREGQGQCCIYPAHSEAAWTVLAISFFSLLVILIFLMMTFVAPGRWFYWRQMNFRGKSVDARIVEALPHFVFGSDCETGGTCAICLEDYKDGDIVKLLPCRHEFHSSCVDSWLTKWGTFCPVCKLDMKTKFAYSEIKREFGLQNQ